MQIGLMSQMLHVSQYALKILLPWEMLSETFARTFQRFQIYLNIPLRSIHDVIQNAENIGLEDGVSGSTAFGKFIETNLRRRHH